MLGKIQCNISSGTLKRCNFYKQKIVTCFIKTAENATEGGGIFAKVGQRRQSRSSHAGQTEDRFSHIEEAGFGKTCLRILSGSATAEGGKKIGSTTNLGKKK